MLSVDPSKEGFIVAVRVSFNSVEELPSFGLVELLLSDFISEWEPHNFVLSFIGPFDPVFVLVLLNAILA